MAIQLQGNGNVVAEVDGTTYRALRQTARPLDYSTGGAYRNSMRSGTIAATMNANLNVYSFRNPSATLLAVVHRVRAQMFANIAFTAAFNDMSMKMHIARSYTSAFSTNGTAATLTGNNAKLRTSMATCASIIHILNTSASGLTGGSSTNDTDPFVISQIGKPNNPNTAAATEYLTAQPMVMLEYEPDMGDGACPLILAQNEGFIIQNGPITWPAAGTGIIKVEVQWSEVVAF